MPLPRDPLLADQWYISNADPNELDLNVVSVWNPDGGRAYTGSGVRIAILDDGFDYRHSDLDGNYNQSIDYDYRDRDNDPLGISNYYTNDAHGTAVAGIIAAEADGRGAVGIAYGSTIFGYRLDDTLSNTFLNQVAQGIIRASGSANADIINMSLGVANNPYSQFGQIYSESAFSAIDDALNTAVSSGRGGLGTILVKAAGNSREALYDVNAESWGNNTQQVVVAAVDANGYVSDYSSYGAAVLVSAFGGPGDIVTTDRLGTEGYSGTDYAYDFNGTSAAAPMVSGVVALMLEANSGLGWRDVQSILANSAIHVGSEVGARISGDERFTWGWNGASNWNGGAMHFSNDYGYGLVDTHAAVRLAETWLLGGFRAATSSNENSYTLDLLNSTVTIPDGTSAGRTFQSTISSQGEVERVTVAITFSTTYLGDVDIYLISPDGTVSTLIQDPAGSADYSGTWTFESQAFRGEDVDGTWSVRIVDDAAGDSLSVSDITITVHGSEDVNDRYVFTDEYSDYVSGIEHSNAITDRNGGNSDTINAAAVTTASIIRLDGSASRIDGVSSTFRNIENAIGGDAGDQLYGSSAANQLYGMRGNDLLDGGAGNDTLDGGAGNDTLRGGAGADRLVGGDGTDYASYLTAAAAVTVDFATVSANTGEAAGDTYSGIENLQGSTHNDILRGNNSANTISGEAGNDQIEGRGGNDRLYGAAGDDRLFGGAGNDALYGGAGRDTLNGGVGADALYGGDGVDYASYLEAAAAVTVDFASVGANTGEAAGDTYSGIENIQGSTHNDILRGNGSANVISGEAGNDQIEGRAGNDTLYGAAGDDRLFGGAGNDALYGGAGRDILNGGVGADALYGGDGVDYASYLDAAAAITVDFASVGSNTGEAAGDTYSGIENIQGSTHNDILRGNGSANVISGEAGNDQIEGRAGNDTLYGAAGNDRLFGGDGDDFLFGGAGRDTLSGGAGRDTFVFNSSLVSGNADHISDFVAADDTIQLDDAVFNALATGALSASAFSASGAATSAQHRIIYDSRSGEVFYDADGNGAGAGVLVLTLNPNTALTHNDFIVV